MKPRRPRSRWSFTRQLESPNVHMFRVPTFKNPTKISTRRHPERQEKKMVAGEGEKRAKFWAVRGGWSREGEEGGPVVGRRVVQGSEPTNNNNHNNHNNTNNTNNINTARSRVEAKPKMKMARKGWGGGEGGPKGGVPKVAPKGLAPLFGFRVWVWRSECKSLGLGFGLFGLKIWPKTLKLAKVGLAKSAMTAKSFQRALSVTFLGVVGRKLHPFF